MTYTIVLPSMANPGLWRIVPPTKYLALGQIREHTLGVHVDLPRGIVSSEMPVDDCGESRDVHQSRDFHGIHLVHT